MLLRDGANLKEMWSKGSSDSASGEHCTPKIVSSIVAALIVTLLEYFSHFAFAAAVYDNERMRDFVYFGFVANLTAYIASNIIYCGFGSIPFGIVSTPSYDIPITAAAVSSLVTDLPPDAELWPSVLALIFTINVGVGFIFCLLCKMRALAWTNFIPTPVISGFLAGNGVSLIKSAFTVSGGMSIDISTESTRSELFRKDKMLLCLPAAIFGTLFFVCTRYKERFPIFRPERLFIILVMIGVFVFYIIMISLEIDTNTAVSEGWLFEAPSSSTLW